MINLLAAYHKYHSIPFSNYLKMTEVAWFGSAINIRPRILLRLRIFKLLLRLILSWLELQLLYGRLLSW